ncbi:hypothetical protein [Delftia acidovorans]|uniref:hypothetical protein n=1 Tax=Delftia acidovorans TaxID=80866 RepID=UPI003D0DEFC8
MENQNRTNAKIVNFRVNDDLFADMELVRERLGVNWSFALRDFIQEKVSELKPTAQAKLKR